VKSLRNAGDEDEILRRLERVRPESERRWGRMTAHEMVCHLADGMRLYMREKEAAMVPALAIQRKVMKWGALWAPIPWPHGFKTMPEIDQQGGRGTKPGEFAEDVRKLRDLTERFVRLPQDFAFRPHPFFGAMKYHEWMRLAYLHCDHHLRQFGA
jgi:uncharacterized protein DUF1569